MMMVMMIDECVAWSLQYDTALFAKQRIDRLFSDLQVRIFIVNTKQWLSILNGQLGNNSNTPKLVTMISDIMPVQLF